MVSRHPPGSNCLYFYDDFSFSDIEISFFDAFTSAHMHAVVSSGVGGSGL